MMATKVRPNDPSVFVNLQIGGVEKVTTGIKTVSPRASEIQIIIDALVRSVL